MRPSEILENVTSLGTLSAFSYLLKVWGNPLFSATSQCHQLIFRQGKNCSSWSVRAAPVLPPSAAMTAYVFIKDNVLVKSDSPVHNM